MEVDYEEFQVGLLMYFEDEREKMGADSFLNDPIRMFYLRWLYALLPVKPEVAIPHFTYTLIDLKRRWGEEPFNASSWSKVNSSTFGFSFPNEYHRNPQTSDLHKMVYFRRQGTYPYQWQQVRGSLFQILYVTIICRLYKQPFEKFETLYKRSVEEYKAKIGVESFNSHPISKIGVHDIIMTYD